MAGKISREQRLEIGRRRRVQTRARIVSAAFELFGGETGLYASIEDITAAAGVTRATFYNHFNGMADLRNALSYEITHDFLEAVTALIAPIADPRVRASVAIRHYIERVRKDPSWGWSMINLSANGIFFGAETHDQCQRTVREGIESGHFSIRDSALGRDLVVGSALAAIATMLRGDASSDYAGAIVCQILVGLGVEPKVAQGITNQPLPPLF